MVVEVPASHVGIRRIQPFDLAEPGARCVEMGQVNRAGLVVVREVAELPPVGTGLNDREGRVGKVRDSGAAPLLGVGWARAADESDEKECQKRRRRDHHLHYGGGAAGRNG